MSTTLLGTKLHIPPLSRVLVSRPRLVSQLENGINGKLTLLLAPAGFGKTTLVNSWIHRWEKSKSIARSRVAWLGRVSAYSGSSIEPTQPLEDL